MKPLPGIVFVQVVRANKAPWATPADGATWAYRVVTASGNTVIGSKRGARKEVQQHANACAKRLSDSYRTAHKMHRNGSITRSDGVVTNWNQGLFPQKRPGA